MTVNPLQNTQQAYVIPGTSVRPGQTPVQLELFDANGNPWNGGGEVSLPDNVATTEDISAAVDPLVARIEALENASTSG